MARKPVTEMRGGIGPRQRAWDAIRAQGTTAEWTAEDIVRATRRDGDLGGVIDASVLQTYLLCLIAAGIVRVVREEPIRGASKRKFYQLVRDEGVEAPRLRRDGSRVTQGLAQEQMWRSLRMLSHDTNARELAAHASSSHAPVAEAAANDYLQTLYRAGYLDQTQAGKGLGRGGVQARYKLKAAPHGQPAGPRPPMICRAKVVFDPNLQQVVWAPVVTEEDADHGR